MRVLICDRCGARIPLDGRFGKIAWAIGTIEEETAKEESPYDNMDFCESCMAEIRQVIEHKPETPEQLPAAEAPEEPPQAETPERIQNAETPEKPRRGRKAIDEGKICSLTNAGWSAAAIADDMGLSEPTVRNRQRLLREEGRL